MFVRMLGWAYLAQCVGYYFALKASLHGKRLMGSKVVNPLLHNKALNADPYLS